MSKDNIIIVLMFVAVFSIVGNIGQGLYIDEQKKAYNGLKEFYDSAYSSHEPTVTEIPVETHTYTVEGVYPVASEEGNEGEGVVLYDKNSKWDGIFLDGETTSKFELDLEKGDKVKVTIEKGNPMNVFDAVKVEGGR